MTVHPRRAVMELFHLKRVHVLVPTERLGDALREKLSVLSLKPTDLSERSLECLLDCLAYFKLTDVPAARVAVARARELLPTLRGTLLAGVVGNCTRLEEFSVTLQSAPLLKDAIKTMKPDDLASLATAFNRAGLSSPERWALVAEHVIRNVALFRAEDLIAIVEAMSRQRVEYPDFYAVVERHVTDQPSHYISGTQLAELIEALRRANHPLVSLLALSAERTAMGLDCGDAAAIGQEQSAAVIQAFVASCRRVIQDGSLSTITDTLSKCDERRIFQLEVLTLSCERAMSLVASNEAEPSDAFGFVSVALHITKYLPEFHNHAKVQHISQHLLPIMDVCVPLVQVEATRAVTLLSSYLQVFGPPKQQSLFAKALVSQYLSYDSMELLEVRQLLRFAEVMHVFAVYGGLLVLEKHMNMLVVGIQRMQPTALVAMADVFSHIPTARGPNGAFLLTLQTLAGCKRWRAQLKSHDVLTLLKAMNRAKLRNNHVLLEVAALLLQQHSLFTPEQLSQCALYVAQLNFKELDFYTVTAGRVYSNPKCTVSDVCRMLYALTFVVTYVIKVVQEALPRLRIAAQQATPRDITLALYSFVKLRVSRHEDITRVLCDQAVSSAGSFKAKEVLSVLQSVKQLHAHQPLLIEVFARRVSAERSSIPRGLYLSLMSTIGTMNAAALADTLKQELVKMAIAEASTLKPTEFRDALIACASFAAPSASGVEHEPITFADSDTITLLRAAEQKVDALTNIADVCDVVLALTELRRECVMNESPLADRLRRDAMLFMELPNYQNAFRAKGLFRLFPEHVGHAEQSSTGSIGPSSGSFATPVTPANEEPSIGSKLRQFHDAKKSSPSSTSGRKRSGKR